MPRALPPRVLRAARFPSGRLIRVVPVVRAAAWLGDAAAVAVLGMVALIVALPLLRAADLNTGSGDWHAHAFRIREFGAHGLATWTHEWAGGLPLWSSYQFVPHVAGWAISVLTGAGTARSM